MFCCDEINYHTLPHPVPQQQQQLESAPLELVVLGPRPGPVHLVPLVLVEAARRAAVAAAVDTADTERRAAAAPVQVEAAAAGKLDACAELQG